MYQKASLNLDFNFQIEHGERPQDIRAKDVIGVDGLKRIKVAISSAVSGTNREFTAASKGPDITVKAMSFKDVLIEYEKAYNSWKANPPMSQK